MLSAMTVFYGAVLQPKKSACMLTISKGPLTLEGVVKLLADPAYRFELDDTLKEEIATLPDKAKKCDVQGREDRLDAITVITLILIIHEIVKLLSQPRVTDRNAWLARIARLEDASRAGLTNYLCSEVGPLKSLMNSYAPIGDLASAIHTAIFGDRIWTKLIADIGLTFELGALEPGLFGLKPPLTARPYTRALANVMQWLLDDSKVTNRKAVPVCTNLLALNLDSFVSGCRDLLQDVKTELDPSGYKGVTEPLSIRCDLLKHRETHLIGPLLMTGRGFRVLSSEVFAYMKKPLQDSGGVITLIDHHHSGITLPQEAERLLELVGDVKSITVDDCKTAMEKVQTSFDISNRLQGQSGPFIGAMQRVFDDYHSLLLLLLRKKRIEILNTGIRRLRLKKKANWSLKIGKGAESYAEVIDELEVPLLSIGTFLRNEDSIRFALTVRNQVTRIPKVPKGCVDFEPHHMRLREALLQRITNVFKLFGAEPIDTPVFELKEVLTGKYGEDTKLIYDLKDQGGEQLGLRYDLTVPFARYCASNAIDKIKRYHIGKVYRRDEPQLAKGRYREFYQCDVDIAGAYGRMTADTEIMAMTLQLLEELSPLIGNYLIKISHRKLLDGMMELCGVPLDKLRAISSAIDKLDKEPWEAVEREMVEDKGLEIAVTHKLKEFLKVKGSIAEVIAGLSGLEGAVEHPSIAEALEDLTKLSENLEGFPAFKARVVLDTSLARGLDYYTGLIYEAIILEGDVSVGSIAAGGRYDTLIGMFSGKDIPAVGISLGVERVFRLAAAKFEINRFFMMDKIGGPKIPTNKADVYVISIGDGLFARKMEIARMLRAANIRTEVALSEQKLVKLLPTIIEQNVPFGVIFGSDDLARGAVNVKDFTSDSRTESSIKISGLVKFIRECLAAKNRLPLDKYILG